MAHALLGEGVERLVLFEVDATRAQALVDNLNAHFGAERAVLGTDLATALAEADGLVNTTPVGMAKLPGTPLPVALLHPRLWVAEIIYFPLETELLRAARAPGCRTLDGSYMAVFQAVKAFELFSGRQADAARMQAHFAEFYLSRSPLFLRGFTREAANKGQSPFFIQQRLYHPFLLAIIPLANVHMAHLPLAVDKVMRRPELVAPGIPHLVVIIYRHRIPDTQPGYLVPQSRHIMLVVELGRVYPTTTSP